jgi:prepilin-type N-terminal cleavage/methylation domain-containing protein
MARRPRGCNPGFTILELLFAIAIAGTLTVMAVPQSLRALDDFRAHSATRYLAQRLMTARFEAIRRSTAHGLRFESTGADYRLSLVADGNRNGLRTADIQSGIDRTLSPPERLESHFAGVAFGIVEGVPDADGQPAGGTDGVRVGASKLLAMNADGTASAGTLYVRSAGRAQYAVRVLGSTGRIRVLRFDDGRRRWVDVF